MAAKTFSCKLVTPTAQVLDEPVTYASVPGWDGLFGVLPGRAALVTKLGVGELRLDFPDTEKSKGGSRSYLIEDGFAQMVDNRLTILAGKAVPAESIVAAEASAELAASLAKKPSASNPAARQAEQERLRKEQTFARAKVHMAKATGKGI